MVAVGSGTLDIPGHPRVRTDCEVAHRRARPVRDRHAHGHRRQLPIPRRERSLAGPEVSTSRIGIIGCGNISPAYANTLSEFPWIEIAAFADGIPERAEKFAERYGGVALELADMLGDDSIDAVVNLTPAHVHTSVSRRLPRGRQAGVQREAVGHRLRRRSLVGGARRREGPPSRLRTRHVPRRRPASGTHGDRPRDDR